MSNGRIAALAIVALEVVGCGDSHGTNTATEAVQWEPLELVLDRSVLESNPYDPAQIDVSGEFRSASGVVLSIPGFVSRAYTRSLVGGFEKLTPTGDLQWIIRFTPDEPGTWAFHWRVRTPQGEEIGAQQKIEVSPSAAHGLVRRSTRDPRYLEFDDGSPFVPIGENLCWYDGRGTFAYDEWITRLAAQGANYIRLWMPSWAFAIEWSVHEDDGSFVSTSLGNYTDRLDRAWQLDYVIELARRHGIQVMLSIQNHGPFSLTNNSEWPHNPYNTANLGPLESPKEFFTDPEAIRLFKQRLRYIVARWGYAANIMSWELWNEVDLAEQPADGVILDWHRDMARELRALDPYDRLISTSTSLGDALAPGSAFAALWELEEIDYTQSHFYSFGVPADFTRVFAGITRRLLRVGKPAFISEAGVDFRGPDETIEHDPNSDGFHDLLWAGLFSEGLGIGMSWWWDNVVDPLDLYFHFGPLASLVDGVDFPGEAFDALTATTTAPDGRPLQAFQLVGSSTVLVWIKNARHQYSSPDVEEVAGATIRIEGLNTGMWAGEWFDTRTGAVTPAAAVGTNDGTIMLDVPTFSRDVALRLRAAGG